MSLPFYLAWLFIVPYILYVITYSCRLALEHCHGTLCDKHCACDEASKWQLQILKLSLNAIHAVWFQVDYLLKVLEDMLQNSVIAPLLFPVSHFDLAPDFNYN